MAASSTVLLIESLDPSSQTLARRIESLGIEPLLVTSFDEAEEVLRARRSFVTAVLIPTDLSTTNLKKDVKRLKAAGPATGLSFLSVGKPPTTDARKRMRSAGITIALWEPYDDGCVRFQLNRAVAGEGMKDKRSSPRVPTSALARIVVGGREKTAVVYSLSKGGCYLETPRASMNGARVDIHFQLRGEAIDVVGIVVLSNVPGNVNRNNLPLGMAVRFEDLDSATRKVIEAFIRDRSLQTEV